MLKSFIFLFADIFCLPRKVPYSGGYAAGKWVVLPPRLRRLKPAGSFGHWGMFPAPEAKAMQERYCPYAVSEEADQRLTPCGRCGSLSRSKSRGMPDAHDLNRSRRPGPAERARPPSDGGLWLRRRPEQARPDAVRCSPKKGGHPAMSALNVHPEKSGEGRSVLPVPDDVAPASVPRDVVLFQLVLHEAAGNTEQLGGMGLHEVGAHERALDERRLNLVQRVGQVELHGQQVHGALEL